MPARHTLTGVPNAIQNSRAATHDVITNESINVF